MKILFFTFTVFFTGLLHADGNLHKAYNYAVAPEHAANWVYLGFAPRAVDPTRVSMHISKGGYTLRVTLEMTEQEVASYPQYLVRRAQKVSDLMRQLNLTFEQPSVVYHFASQIAQVQQNAQMDYKNGLRWLKTFFPNNVFEVSNPGGIRVVAHFVYPITISRFTPIKPFDNVYTIQGLEERRSYHEDQITGQKDHVFGGFPAMWFNGHIGVHGPIEVSRMSPDLWNKNEFANPGYDKQADISPRYRTDLIRTRASQGCIRSESMEIRHLLPANEQLAKQVPIYVMSAWDQVTLPKESTPRYVNVDYYLVNHKSQAGVLTQDVWLQRHAPNMLTQKDQMINFPYLDTAVVEYRTPSRQADYQGMLLLNRAD